MPKLITTTSRALTGGRGLFNYAGLEFYGKPALAAREASKRPKFSRPAPSRAEAKRLRKRNLADSQKFLRAMRGRRKK